MVVLVLWKEESFVAVPVIGFQIAPESDGSNDHISDSASNLRISENFFTSEPESWHLLEQIQTLTAKKEAHLRAWTSFWELIFVAVARPNHAMIFLPRRSCSCVVAGRALPFAHCLRLVMFSAISFESGTVSTKACATVKSVGFSCWENPR
jgi:hypothetical protein